MEILLKKIETSLYPIDDEGANYLFQCKQGQIVKAKISKPRNILFHRKYFSLLNLAFEAFEPNVKYKGQIIEKNFERFREDIQILAGYGIPTVNIKGEVRYISKSISFGSMEEDDFDKLYSSVINVILKHILTNYKHEDLEQVVNEVINYG